MKEKSKYHHIKLTSEKHLLWRRIVYILFAAVFLIITPTIILYTQGYRYNFKRGRIQKTGILIASSIPKRADIYLNGKLIEGDQTPVRVERLLPADYEIKLSKDGYHDWSKRLQILENSTTFAEDVILWKSNTPVEIGNYTIISSLNSRDNKKNAFITKDREVMFFDLDSGGLNRLHQIEQYENPQIISWSNTNKKILVKSASNFLALNTESGGIDLVTIDSNYELIKWDLENDNIVYGLNDNGVWRIDLFTRKEELIFDTYVSDFLIKDDTFYTLRGDDIYKQVLYDSKNPEILDSIKCDDCRFVNRDFSKLILLDETKQNIYIVDPNKKDKTIKREAKGISWLDDDTLLFYNDWEIWIYHKNKPEPEIITRIGSGIKEALWHTEGRHIIFISDNKIKIIELDNRELRNMIELWPGNEIDNLVIDSKGRNLYFSNKLDNVEYLMTLNIK